jgi:hypothetical protein
MLIAARVHRPALGVPSSRADLVEEGMDVGEQLNGGKDPLVPLAACATFCAISCVAALCCATVAATAAAIASALVITERIFDVEWRRSKRQRATRPLKHWAASGNRSVWLSASSRARS